METVTSILPGSILPPHNVYEVLMFVNGEPRVESFSGQTPAGAEAHAKKMYPESPIHIARENCPFEPNTNATRIVIAIGVITFLAIVIATAVLYFRFKP